MSAFELLISLLNLPVDKVLNAIAAMEAKRPEVAPALDDLRDLVMNVPEAIANIPVDALAEIKEAVETGMAGVPKLPLE